MLSRFGILSLADSFPAEVFQAPVSNLLLDNQARDRIILLARHDEVICNDACLLDLLYCALIAHLIAQYPSLLTSASTCWQKPKKLITSGGLVFLEDFRFVGKGEIRAVRSHILRRKRFRGSNWLYMQNPSFLPS